MSVACLALRAVDFLTCACLFLIGSISEKVKEVKDRTI